MQQELVFHQTMNPEQKKQYSGQSCLPKLLRLASSFREILQPKMNRFPKKWSYEDQILAWLSPAAFQKDIESFYSGDTSSIEKLFEAHQLRSIDNSHCQLLKQIITIDISSKLLPLYQELSLKEKKYSVTFSRVKNEINHEKSTHKKQIGLLEKELLDTVECTEMIIKKIDINTNLLVRCFVLSEDITKYSYRRDIIKDSTSEAIDKLTLVLNFNTEISTLEKEKRNLENKTSLSKIDNVLRMKLNLQIDELSLLLKTKSQDLFCFFNQIKSLRKSTESSPSFNMKIEDQYPSIPLADMINNILLESSCILHITEIEGELLRKYRCNQPVKKQVDSMINIIKPLPDCYFHSKKIGSNFQEEFAKQKRIAKRSIQKISGTGSVAIESLVGSLHETSILNLFSRKTLNSFSRKTVSDINDGLIEKNKHSIKPKNKTDHHLPSQLNSEVKKEKPHHIASEDNILIPVMEKINSVLSNSKTILHLKEIEKQIFEKYNCQHSVSSRVGESSCECIKMLPSCYLYAKNLTPALKIKFEIQKTDIATFVEDELFGGNNIDLDQLVNRTINSCTTDIFSKNSLESFIRDLCNEKLHKAEKARINLRHDSSHKKQKNELQARLNGETPLPDLNKQSAEMIIQAHASNMRSHMNSIPTHKQREYPKGVVVTREENSCAALIQVVNAADLDVRSTNVILKNCSSLEELNSLTEETLLNLRNCGRKTVCEIIHFLNVFRNKGIIETPPSIKEQLSNPPCESSLCLLPFFSSLKYEELTVADLHPNFRASTKLADLDLSVRTANVLNTLKIESIGEVMLSSRTALLKQQNFGRKSLSELEDIIKSICPTNSNVSGNQVDKLFPIDYTSYESMVSSFIEQCEKNNRNQRLFIKRLCFQEGKVPTLEELGQHFDISRERARQILKNGTIKLHKKANLEKLAFFWERLDLIVSQGGGLVSLGALPSILHTKFNWPTAPYSLAIGQLLLLRQPTGTFKEENDLFRVECECLSCDRPLQQLQSLDFDSTESFHFKVVAKKLHEHCQSTCPWQPVTTFHKAYIKQLVDKSEGCLVLHKDVILTYDKWVSRHSTSLEEITIHILKEKGNPMHFSDIAQTVRDNSIRYKDASNHSVHSALLRYDGIELTKRGTYSLKTWGMGGYRSISKAIEAVLDKKGLPMRSKHIAKELDGEFPGSHVYTALSSWKTRFIGIGDGFYDRPQNWQQCSCHDFIKLLPESVADLARYLVSRNNTSYKLVMAFIFIRSMDEEGTIYLYKLRDMFYNFYLSRHKKGQVVELETTVMSRIDKLSSPEIKNKACPKPLTSFLGSGFFQEFSRDGARLRLVDFLVTDLQKKITKDILLITLLKAIDDYFLEISPNAPMGMSNYETIKSIQDFTLTTSEADQEQQSPTISIKKKGRSKIRL